MKNNTILVTGGNGKTGRKVAAHLTERGYSVRIGSRNGSPAFDWNNPDTWPAALEGMDIVYISYQPDLAVPAALKTIKAFTALAVEKGVSHLVILSGRGEKEAQECEEVVMNSGVNWTVLRCDWFFQNFSESFFLDPILGGHVSLPQSDTKIPFIDTDDIAEVAVHSIVNKQYGTIHELTGSELLTFEEVTSIVSEVTGRPITYQSISLEAYVAMLKEFQIPEDYIWLINYLFTNVLDGRNSSTTDGVEKALGRKPKTFREYAVETAKTGVWNAEVKS
ncbi:MAG: NmrA family NAD(P)-binding protein [Bacteroidota bacterium]